MDKRDIDAKVEWEGGLVAYVFEYGGLFNDPQLDELANKLLADWSDFESIYEEWLNE